MGVLPARTTLIRALVIILFVFVVAGGWSTTAGATSHVSCTSSPTVVEVGETVTIDASATDAGYVEFDFDEDGVYESGDETDFIDNTTYQEPGTYTPVVRADGDPDSTAQCDEVIVNAPPTADLQFSPTVPVTGENVTFDASGSTDSDGTIEEYRWDFDADFQIDRVTNDSITEASYDTEGGTAARVTVVDNRGSTDSTLRELFVQENQPPTAELSVSPRPATVGENVTFDASGSSDPDREIVEFRWDFAGDGTIDRTTERDIVEAPYTSSGSKVPSVTVVDTSDATATASTDLFVERQSNAVCTASPTTVEVGETVTLDASDSLASFVEFDLNGNGEYTEGNEVSFIVNTSYDEPGTYEPRARADGDEEAVDPCGEIVVEDNQPPTAEFSVDPQQGTVGESVSFDASASVDPDGSIIAYRWDFDGDGTIDENTSSPITEHPYQQASGYAPTLIVEDDDGATDTTTGDLIVEQPRSLVCELSATEVEPGENVTLDASGSEGVGYVEFDYEGDGEYDDGSETDFLSQTNYEENGTYTPTVRADGEGPVEPCGEIIVEEPPDESEGGTPIPLWPIGVGGGGILGLGLLYYLFSGGGAGGGGGGSDMPKPKKKPGIGSAEKPRYETGVFEIPPSSGTVSVPIGFQPDLVFFSASNGARTDSATDRTAGWSKGIAFLSKDGPINYSLSVADDGQTMDQATCAADDRSALQLFRHSSERPPGRIHVRLAGTSSNGFEVDVQVPGDDPFASGMRVHYQAIRTATDVDVDVGTFMTPTEPGTQIVDLEITADHVSLLGSSAVIDSGRLWTTDRGIGMTGGHAIKENDRIQQAGWGASAWPGSGHDSAAVADDGGIRLLYQDADCIAGRTRGDVTDIGSQLRLSYDRAYNGPHKLGSTARHVFAYLAMNGGETMRPAVGAVPMPGPGERLQVDCGFVPEMIEVTISNAPPGDEVPTWAAPQPFGWSEGTAIRHGDGLRQYVLHHAHTPTRRTGSAGSGVSSAAGQSAATGSASTDGGSRVESSTSSQSKVDDVAQAEESRPAEEDPFRLRPPTEVPDDGIVGITLLQDPEGTVQGRDECRIDQLTTCGFDVTVDRVDTDDTRRPESNATLIYRAWPSADGRDNYVSAERTPNEKKQAGGSIAEGAGTAGQSAGGGVPQDGANLNAGSEQMHDLDQQQPGRKRDEQ